MPSNAHATGEVALALIRSQFPRWADLPIEPVDSSGTANTLFRLGGELVIRLPRTPNSTRAIDKEHYWLPRLRPHLTLSAPISLAVGTPTDDFPAPWAVYSWLEGDDGWTRPIEDLRQAAIDLAGFIHELRRIDSSEAPRAGEHNNFRGVPLSDRDPLVRRAMDELGDRIDTGAVTRIWDLALEQPLCADEGWVHGDLQPGNQLTQRGKLTAVIDFSHLGFGDPACDLLPAWNLLTRDTRRVFRGALQLDDATWIRGQGWALYQSLLALPYYWDTNPVMVRMAQRQIHEILTER